MVAYVSEIVSLLKQTVLSDFVYIHQKTKLLNMFLLTYSSTFLILIPIKVFSACSLLSKC